MGYTRNFFSIFKQKNKVIGFIFLLTILMEKKTGTKISSLHFEGNLSSKKRKIVSVSEFLMMSLNCLMNQSWSNCTLSDLDELMDNKKKQISSIPVTHLCTTCIKRIIIHTNRSFMRNKEAAFRSFPVKYYLLKSL